MKNDNIFYDWLWSDRGVGISGYAMATIQYNMVGLSKSRRLFLQNAYNFSHHLARNNTEALMSMTAAFMTGKCNKHTPCIKKVKRIIEHSETFDEAKNKTRNVFWAWLKYQHEEETRYKRFMKRAYELKGNRTLEEYYDQLTTETAHMNSHYQKQQQDLKLRGHLPDREYQDWLFKLLSEMMEASNPFSISDEERAILYFENLPDDRKRDHEVRVEGTYKKGVVDAYVLPCGEDQLIWKPQKYRKEKWKWMTKLNKIIKREYKRKTKLSLEDRF